MKDDLRTPAPDGRPADGGQMSERVRTFDWSTTPLGPRSAWPQSLDTTVRILLESRYPMFLWWGPELTNIYNDAYVPVLGARHPAALGGSAKAIWSDVWDVVGPQCDAVLRQGHATWNESVLLVMQRHGYAEETYFTFSYSPARDDDGAIAGVFCACTEDTARVLAERRLRVLRALGEHDIARAETATRVCRDAVASLARNTHDLPFVLVYLLDGDGRTARLETTAHLEEGSAAAPIRVEIGSASDVWGFERVIRTGLRERVAGLDQRFGRLPAGPWADAATSRALVLPLPRGDAGRTLAGFLVAGLSPLLPLDQDYRTFLDLAANQLATALANARAHEAERRRVRALAELDRAKTVFFSNVSHEFRTPLTLMLGPLQEALTAREAIPADVASHLDVVHRNALRLLKLVNSLLEFSRIEAGRAHASPEPTDLASLTADLSSNFRSACERASLRLLVDCPPLDGPVHVDRDMWEKVVLNLLSNAFKFTHEGEIEVSLRANADHATLRVRDTGVGIPSEELPRLFERFHRVENARGRTHEGSGIGLALVQELVKLHGGNIDVTSEVDRGTTVSVTVPREPARAPAARAGETPRPDPASPRVAAYVEEALGWLPDDVGAAESVAGAAHDDHRPRVLLADDNADMREYVRRLLGTRFVVESVGDGATALQVATHSPPDIVLADVMMPGLDGFALARELRDGAATRDVPIVLLSARAGEEARVEGLDAGADDYLTKPFSARELLARIDAHLDRARARRESERLFQEIADTAPAMLWITAPDDECVFLSRAWYEFTGQTPAEGLGFGWVDAIHPDDRDEVARAFRSSSEKHQPVAIDYRLRRADGVYRWVLDAGRPRFDETGRWLGYIGSVIDVHERRAAEDAVRQSTAHLRAVADHVPVMISYVDRSGFYRFVNAQYEEWFGMSADAVIGKHVREVLGDEVWEQRKPFVERVLGGEAIRFEGPTIHRRLGRRDTEMAYVPDPGAEGEIRGFYVRGVDITDRKRDEGTLRRQSERLRLLSEAAAVILTASDPQTMLDRVFSKIGDHLGVDTYFHFMVDDGSDTLRLVAYSGIPDEAADALARIPFGQSLCGVSALERRRVEASFIQTSDDPRATPVREQGIRAYACNPLIAGDRVLGTLAFGSRSRDRFDPDEVEFLGTISRYVTAAYEQIRLIDQLREADRRKDEFLATLAHELRNPLAPIRTALQLLELAPGDEEAMRSSLAVMDRQTTQLARLIDDLLDVSRITRGRLQLRKTTVALADVIQNAIEVARPLIDAAEHDLTVMLPDEPVLLDADLTRLAQVFSNLLSNAAKYNSNRGRIWLTAERSDDDAVVRVRDDGLGIPPEMLDRIFEMFMQLDRSAETGYTGLGIGLTLVESLVRMHGGAVSVRSEGPGRGSEFVVRLPCLPETAETATEADHSTPEPGASRRVLVVDDNADAADLLTIAVEMLGNEVRTARDGVEAVELAEQFRPEVVLMDIGMPRMNGYEAARRIREQQWGKRMTLVALTGWGQESDRQRTREAGFDHHLVKPAEPDAIRAIIHRDGAGDGAG